MQIIRISLKLFFLIASFSELNAQRSKASLDKVVAVVGDQIILESEIKSSIEDVRQQMKEIPQGAECLLIEQAVIWKILALQAEKDSIIVTNEDVEDDLNQRISHFVSQLGSVEAFETYCGKTVYQFKDGIRELVRESMLANAMKQRITSNVTISPSEVKAFFEKIPPQSIPQIPVSVEVAQITVFPKPTKEMEQYTIAELNNYRRQIQSKVASFEQLAQRFSQDSASKDRGGTYQINRLENGWDPAFIAATLKLREGEISAPVKTKSGYHIIQMVERINNDAAIRHILRIPTTTDADMNLVKAKMDTVRWRIISGTLSFTDACKLYTESDSEKMAGPDILNQDGSPYMAIDQLDIEMATLIQTMNPGEYSVPQIFINEQRKKAVRIIYLKSRKAAHKLNLRDDYVTISQLAREQKQNEVMQKWILAKLPGFYIQIEPSFVGNCQQLAKYTSGN